jgi:hypothetical protein
MTLSEAQEPILFGTAILSSLSASGSGLEEGAGNPRSFAGTLNRPAAGISPNEMDDRHALVEHRLSCRTGFPDALRERPGETVRATPARAGGGLRIHRGAATGSTARSSAWRSAARRSASVSFPPSAVTWNASTTWSRCVLIFAARTDSPAAKIARATS